MKKVLLLIILGALLYNCNLGPKTLYEEEVTVEKEQIVYKFTIKEVTYENIKQVINLIEEKWNYDVNLKNIDVVLDGYHLVFIIEDIKVMQIQKKRHVEDIESREL